MEPIVEEKIEMPEAQTDRESRDMLRYFIQYAHINVHSQNTNTHLCQP